MLYGICVAWEALFRIAFVPIDGIPLIMKKTAILLVLVMGCTAWQRQPEEPGREPPLTLEDIRSAERIVVVCGLSCSVSRTNTSTRGIFEASGKCYGEESMSQERFSLPIATSKATLEYPPETFAEVKNILLASGFVRLKSGFQEVCFESTHNISVEVGRRKLDVTFSPCPKECEALLAFMNKLHERGKVTSSSKSGD